MSRVNWILINLLGLSRVPECFLLTQPYDFDSHYLNTIERAVPFYVQIQNTDSSSVPAIVSLVQSLYNTQNHLQYLFVVEQNPASHHQGLNPLPSDTSAFISFEKFSEFLTSSSRTYTSKSGSGGCNNESKNDSEQDINLIIHIQVYSLNSMAQIFEQNGSSLLKRNSVSGSWTILIECISCDSSFNSEGTQLLALAVPLNAKVYLYYWTAANKNIVSSNNTMNNDESFSLGFLRLFEVYNIKNKPFINELDLWRNRTINDKFSTNWTGFPYYSLIGYAQRRADFQGVEVVGTAAVDPTNKLYFDVEIKNGQTVFLGGYTINIYWDLRDALNFTEKPLAGEYISHDEGVGSVGLTGMGKQIADGDADIGLSFAFLLPYRASFLTFTHNYFTSMTFLAFRQPNQFSMRNIYLEPFQTSVWTAILTAWSVFLIAFYISYHFLLISTSRKGTTKKDEGHSCRHTDENVIRAVASFCQQGWYWTPQSFSLRTILFTMYTTSFIIFVAYCAKIVANLSVDVIPIQTIVDFMTKHNLKILSDSMNDQAHSLSKYYSLPLEDVRNRFILVGESKEQSDLENQIRQTMSGQYAKMVSQDRFFGTAASIGYKSQEVCHLITILPVQGSDSRFAMFVNKESPIKELVNFKTLLMLERGWNFRYLSTISRQTVPLCEKRKILYKEDLGYQEVLPAYVALFTGLFGSILFLCFENIFIWCKRNC